jgi:curved DNA-binding protein CbpA
VSQDKAARIPKAGARVDLRSLPIGPEEAFVFSRVDGVSSEAEIALGTGLSEERVRQILVRLADLGAVQKDDAVLETQASGAHALRTSEIPNTLRSPKGASLPAKPAEPATSSGTALSAEIRRELVALHENLAQKDHYQVLGLSRGADRQAIKAAYFALISRFHPDRHYGKDLGVDKAQLEHVIARLTEAYDTLTRTQLRSEYNASLPPAADTSNPLPQIPVAPAAGAEAPSATSAKPSQQSSKPFDSQTRKRALARRLSTSVQPQQSRTSMTLQAMGAARPGGGNAETVPALRVDARTISSRRHELAAEQALKEHNPIAAANSLRLALSINPEDASLKLRLEQAQAEADTRLKDRLESDARNAEQAGKHGEAAVLYGRAARGGKNAELFYKAAECSILAADNPRLAAEFAKGGLLLAPNHARLHLLLGRIYADAGMTASALAELEKAKRLSPDDDTINAWLERVKKRRE